MEKINRENAMGKESLDELIKKEIRDIKAFEKCLLPNGEALGKLVSSINNLPEEKKNELLEDPFVRNLLKSFKETNNIYKDIEK